MKWIKAQKRVRTGVLIAYQNIHQSHEVAANIYSAPCPHIAAVLSDLLNRKIMVLFQFLMQLFQ
jgi:late competence protein required for DNA uptake (superfamily II DNA/RNA helicase)